MKRSNFLRSLLAAPAALIAASCADSLVEPETEGLLGESALYDFPAASNIRDPFSYTRSELHSEFDREAYRQVFHEGFASSAL